MKDNKKILYGLVLSIYSKSNLELNNLSKFTIIYPPYFLNYIIYIIICAISLKIKNYVQKVLYL